MTISFIDTYERYFANYENEYSKNTINGHFHFIQQTAENYKNNNLFYRLWQAVKHIFLRSDWDLSVKYLSMQLEQSFFGFRLKGAYDGLFTYKNNSEKLILEQTYLWKSNLKQRSELLFSHLVNPTKTPLASLEEFEENTPSPLNPLNNF